MCNEDGDLTRGAAIVIAIGFLISWVYVYIIAYQDGKDNAR